MSQEKEEERQEEEQGLIRKERTEFIYVLLDGNDHIFYCGRSVNVERRLKEHLEESLAGGTSKKCHHIRELLARGDEIKIKKVDEAPASEIAELEAWWINRLDFNVEDLGYTVVLFNSNAGSQGNKIDEAKLRADIQEFKRRKKMPKSTALRPLIPPTPEQTRQAELLYETDPVRFRLVLEARRELRKMRERSLK
jgi:hypothetical protein